MTETKRLIGPSKGPFFLFGPRGTGKTTWLKAAFPRAFWIDLLDPAQERTFTSHPEELTSQVDALPNGSTVVIDEVQRAPAILTVVHAMIERKRGLQFVLTGSSARKLKRSGVDLLAGRALLRHMHPFLASELGEGFDLERALTLGLVPGIWAASDPENALKAYLALYVREEVKAEGIVRDLGSFGRFLEAISFSHGSVLNLANVSRECQVSRSTVDGYVQVLEDLLLAWQMPVFSKRAQRQLVSHSKFWWFDTGVFRSARPAGPLDRTEEIAGAALEGLVAQHLRAWIDYSERDVKMYFWRTKSGNEVDFVLYGKDCFFALEVKNRARVFPKDLGSLRAFGEDYPEAKRALLYRGTRRLRTGGILCLPCDEFLRQLRPKKDLPVG